MKRSSWVLLIIAGLLLGGGGLWMWLGQAPKLSPEQAIARSLDDAERGARRRRVPDVMAVISDDFETGGVNKDRLRLLLLRTFQQSRGVTYDTHINAPKISPSRSGPQERVVTTRLSVFDSGSGDDYYKQSVVLVMRQESRSRYFFFREPYWRIVRVVNGMPAFSSFAGFE